MISCYIGLGSNLNKPAAQLRAACKSLRTIPKTSFICASSVYRTSPVGKIDQPDFLNAVAKLDTKLPSLSLLDALQEIENIQGRTRTERWGARNIDLDILLFGDQAFSFPRLTVPHPRLHLRMFMLAPLLEICDPNKLLPSGCMLKDVIQGCGSEKVQKTSISLFEDGV